MSETNGHGPKQLLPADIVGRRDRHIVTVPLPEYGGVWYGRELSLNQRDRVDDLAVSGELTGIRSLVIAMAWCDEDGNDVEVSPAEVEALGRAGTGGLDRCYTAIAQVSHISGRDTVLEDESKNGEGTSTGSS